MLRKKRDARAVALYSLLAGLLPSLTLKRLIGENRSI
jgi:hypothetical protein